MKIIYSEEIMPKNWPRSPVKRKLSPVYTIAIEVVAVYPLSVAPTKFSMASVCGICFTILFPRLDLSTFIATPESFDMNMSG